MKVYITLEEAIWSGYVYMPLSPHLLDAVLD